MNIDKNEIRKLARVLWKAKKDLGIESTDKENWKEAEEYLKSQK